MNNDKMIEVLGLIEDDKFNMDQWFKDWKSDRAEQMDSVRKGQNLCGTTLCFAGWTAYAYSEQPLKTLLIESFAQEELELTDSQAYWIFIYYSGDNVNVGTEQRMEDAKQFITHIAKGEFALAKWYVAEDRRTEFLEDFGLTPAEATL